MIIKEVKVYAGHIAIRTNDAEPGEPEHHDDIIYLLDIKEGTIDSREAWGLTTDEIVECMLFIKS